MNNTTSDYERYWREEGQFLEPSGNLSSEALELAKRVGAAVWEDQQGAINEARKEREDAQEDKDEAEAGFREFKESVLKQIQDSGTNCIPAIRKLCENED